MTFNLNNVDNIDNTCKETCLTSYDRLSFQNEAVNPTLAVILHHTIDILYMSVRSEIGLYQQFQKRVCLVATVIVQLGLLTSWAERII